MVSENQKIKLNNLDKDVKQVLLGSLAGDGYLTKLKKAKNAYYREVHSIKQEDYVLWKYNFLKVFNLRIHRYKTFDKRTNKYYYSILIWSKVNPILTGYHNLLYKEDKKIITTEFLNQISVFGLAVWYMDDGYYHYGNYRCGFGTDSFSYKEHKIIKDWLRGRFSIETQIHSRRITNGTKRYTLIIPKKDLNKFLKLIEPYIIPSMYYKLGHLKEENKNKIKKHYEGRILYRKLHYKNNREKYLKQNRLYRELNKEKLERKRKVYYLNNKDKILKQKKKYHLRNREKIIKRMRSRYHQNIEENRKKGREYYYKNHEEILKRGRIYWNKNKDILNQRRRKRYKKKMEEMKNEAFH